MIVLPGAIGWGALLKYSVFFQGLNVTILNVATVISEDIVLPDLVAGDIVFFSIYTFNTKGGVAGDTTLSLIHTAGVSNVERGGGLGDWNFKLYAVPAGVSDERYLVVMGRVVGNGPSTWQLSAVSLGSNATQTVAGVKSRVYVMRGS